MRAKALIAVLLAVLAFGHLARADQPATRLMSESFKVYDLTELRPASAASVPDGALHRFWVGSVHLRITNVTNHPIYMLPQDEFLVEDETGRTYAANWDSTALAVADLAKETSLWPKDNMASRPFSAALDPRLQPFNPNIEASFPLVFDLPYGPQRYWLVSRDGSIRLSLFGTPPAAPPSTS